MKAEMGPENIQVAKHTADLKQLSEMASVVKNPRLVEVGIGPGRSYVNFDARIWTVESLAIGSGVTAAAAIEGEFDKALVVRSFE